MLAVEKAGGSALTMLQRIQQTHYRDGIWTGSIAVLAELAVEQKISAEQFVRAKEQVNVVAHMNATQKLMARLGVSGYPSIALQQDDNWQLISLNSFLGKPDAFKKHLEKMIHKHAV
jgi:putative protein-disulfide isomerase